MKNTVAQRRHVFIKKGFQGRFIASAILLILLSGLCSALLIYWITGGDLQAQAQSAHINIVTAADRLGVSILIGNLVAILIAGSIAVMSVLYASHKIAGPLYRFEALCREVGEGNLDTVTKLRETDQLQELARAFAEMVGKLRRRRAIQVELVQMLDNRLNELAAADNLRTEQQQCLVELQTALSQLRGSCNGDA